MIRFLKDIVRQEGNRIRCLEHAVGDARCWRSDGQALARHLRNYCTRAGTVGQHFPDDAFGQARQFLTGMLPVQMAAKCLLRLRGVDCDNVRICARVVDAEEEMTSAAKKQPTQAGGALPRRASS